MVFIYHFAAESTRPYIGPFVFVACFPGEARKTSCQ